MLFSDEFSKACKSTILDLENLYPSVKVDFALF
jgi:hypothetical protein